MIEFGHTSKTYPDVLARRSDFTTQHLRQVTGTVGKRDGGVFQICGHLPHDECTTSPVTHGALEVQGARDTWCERGVAVSYLFLVILQPGPTQFDELGANRRVTCMWCDQDKCP